MDAGPEQVSRCGVRLLFLFVAGCGLSEAECLELRAAAFELENRAQPCMDDSDCSAAEWPGCAKAVESAAAAEVGRLGSASSLSPLRKSEQAAPGTARAATTSVRMNRDIVVESPLAVEADR